MVMKLNGTNGLTFPDTTTLASAGQSSVQAWVNFDGTTATPSTIRASFNVSSVTRNATGDYTVNFATALVDANYIRVGYADFPNSGSSRVVFNAEGDIKTTSACQCRVIRASSDAAQNAKEINVAFFR
jgi:hypothetical protein